MTAPVPPGSRPSIAFYVAWVLGAVVLVLAGALAWTWNSHVPPTAPAVPAAEPEPSPPGEGAAKPVPVTGPPALPEAEAARWEAAAVALAGWPPPAVDDATCREVRGDLEEALAGAGLPGDGAPVEVVDRVLEALAGARPVASGELRDCDALVGNVFLLARALGRDRLVALAGAARGARVDPEIAALALWRYVTVAPGCGNGRAPGRERLYEYGVWVLDTVGGSAFLARRSPRRAALVAFYALLAVDRAAREGYNPAGYDLAAGARRVRAMLEGVDLRWKERYLQAVDEVEAAAP